MQAQVESLQGALDELKVEKSRMQQAHENQLQEIQRLNSVQGEKSSLLAELQEVRGRVSPFFGIQVEVVSS